MHNVNKSYKKSVKYQITLLVATIVILSISSLAIFTIKSISQSHEDFLSSKIRSEAIIISKMPEIINTLKAGDPDLRLPQLAIDIGNTINAWIIIMDMNSVRYSHTNPALIGLKFTGGDEFDALQGKSYTSKADGISGPSLRGFAPIYGEDNKQIGAVCVGVLSNGIAEGINKTRYPIYIASFLSLTFGIIGSYLVSARIKKTIFGYEPYEIATILSAINTGIITVDTKSRIVLVNRTAMEMLEVTPDQIYGKYINEVMASTRLPEIIKTGIPEYDQVQEFPHGKKIITTRVPIIVDNKIMGALAIFRDKTEITKLAEELTGVKKYAEALRAQSHEYINKLQTISGLVELGDYEIAVKFINNITKIHNNLTSSVVKKVNDPLIAGLLLGKASEAYEKGVELIVEKESYLQELPCHIDGNYIVIILGNLLENAVEASNATRKTNKQVRLLLKELDRNLIIRVQDSGSGISPEILENIFKPNFSTKSETRGYGMYNIQKHLAFLQGTIVIDTQNNKGTMITVTIPLEEV